MAAGIPGGSRRVLLVVCAAVVWRLLAGPGAYAAAEHSCAPPAEIPPASPTPVARGNPHARVDYHLLVLTWAPVFLARHALPGACLPGAPFVAGGLIPQSRSAVRDDDHPRHCIPSMPLSRATVRRHFALMPDPQFMQDSWVRHGGCAFANAWEYFDRLTELHGRLRQPDLWRLAPRGAIAAGAVRAAFVAENGDAGLAPEHLAIADDPPGWLESVAACYDVRFRLMACPRPGLPDRTPLRLAGRDDAARGAPRRPTPSTRAAPP